MTCRRSFANKPARARKLRGRFSYLMAGMLLILLTGALNPSWAQEAGTTRSSQVGGGTGIPYWPSEREARMRELGPQIRQLQKDLVKAQAEQNAAEAERISDELTRASDEYGRLRDSMESTTAGGGEAVQP